MLGAVLLSVSEEAIRQGRGVGQFHGYEFRAVRLARRRGARSVRVDVLFDGVMLDSALVDLGLATPMMKGAR